MTTNYVQAVIENLEAGVNPDVVLHNLKAVLDRRGHVRLYGAIVRSVLQSLEVRAGATATVVTVAKSADATSPLVATLLKELGASGENVVTKIDESIIGGAKVSYQSRQIDATHKQSLYSLYQSIIK
jgi:F0F1-type ATP synthase delta subunit